jgi:hypothetical protein
MTEMMTKTRAQSIARRNRRAGYFSPGTGHDKDFLVCPLCHGDVSLAARPYPRTLYAPTGPELDAALIAHLTHRDDDWRCLAVAAVSPRAAWKGCKPSAVPASTIEPIAGP